MRIDRFIEIHKKKTKIILLILLAILLLGFIIYIFLGKNISFLFKNKSTSSIINSSDNIFQISVDNSYNLKYSPSDKYILNIYSNDGFSLTVSKVNKYNFKLKDILISDQENFLNLLGEYSNLSKISEKKYYNISGYTYSLNYINDIKEYKLTEFVTEIENNLYFFDIQYPIKKEFLYKNIQENLLNSISIISNH